MDEDTRLIIEDLLDRRADSVCIAVELLRAHILDKLAIQSLPATQVARDIIRIREESKRDADIVVALLAYPTMAQPAIGMMFGVTRRAVQGVIKRWRGRVQWIDNLADIRSAIATRARTQVISINKIRQVK